MPDTFLPVRGDGRDLPTHLPLPPRRLPAWRGGRPLKRWRYVAAFGEELMLCTGAARVGPVSTSWWAVWDREAQVLHERTWRRRGGVRSDGARVTVRDGDAGLDLRVDEGAWVESVCPHGAHYVWTRKQAGRPVEGLVRVGGRTRPFAAPGVVDDTAGYHARDTAWLWSAGVGEAVDGRAVGWNLVAGVNDPLRGSERSLWVDGEPREVGPVLFDGLRGVAFREGGALRFAAEATRERRDRLGPLRSDYEQPFGAFAGTLPGGLELAWGRGVMERHTARW